MLRADRPRVLGDVALRGDAVVPASREVLFAVAPPPKTHSYVSSGWPSWLVPAYRSGGHRPLVRLLEEER